MRLTALTSAALLASLLLSSLAGAANFVANNSQKGSLLVFPRIDAGEGRTTVVRLTNDNSRAVDILCQYNDAQRNRTGFQLRLTKNQPVWFDARSGQGSVPVAPFPATGSRTGDLKCWATSAGGGTQIKWNHLSGTATLYDFTDATAWAYPAWSFYARNTRTGQPVGRQAGRIDLNGRHYDRCPRYLIGHFSPAGAVLPLGPRGEPVSITGNRLSLTGCTQDLRQDARPVVTQLRFEVWNGHEVKFTGAYQCVDQWYEGLLGELEAGAPHFTFATLGTGAAHFRVEGVRSGQCDGLTRYGQVASQPVGLVGVLASQATLGNGTWDRPPRPVATGTHLTAAGRLAGRILWETGLDEVPEKYNPAPGL